VTAAAPRACAAPTPPASSAAPAPPFQPDDAVVISTAYGGWQRLAGAILLVKKVVRASSYPGGWAVRLRGPDALRVPLDLIASAHLTRAPKPLPTRASPTTCLCGSVALLYGFCALLAFVPRARPGRCAVVPLAMKRIDALSPERLAQVTKICADHGVHLEDICSTSHRARDVSAARSAVIYALHEDGMSSWSLQKLFGFSSEAIRDARKRHEVRLAARAALQRPMA
jgi:hypothetical protein